MAELVIGDLVEDDGQLGMRRVDKISRVGSVSPW